MTECAETVLFRADRSTPRPCEGYGRWWTTDLDHARWYTSTTGFGGPRLFRATVLPAQLKVLDLRPGFWGVVGDSLGLDRADYEPTQQEHELVAEWRPLLAGSGFSWAVLRVRHAHGCFEEWFHCADGALQASEVEA